MTVNLFIPSELDWAEKGIRIRQETKFPEEQKTTLVVHSARPVQFALNVRIPYWVARGGEVKINGEALPAFSSPSSYLTLERAWKDGDRVEITLPMNLHVHPMPDDPTLEAMMFGPLVLAGKLGDSGLSDAATYPGYDTAPHGEPIPVPAIARNPKQPTGWLEPSKNQVLTFTTAGQNENFQLVPLCRLSGERYAVYWKLA